jgi:hypothetical protein
MFKRQTLFIVGAGASREVGFPIGTQLAQSIGQMLTRRNDDTERRMSFGDIDFLGDIQRRTRGNDYNRAADRIAAGIRLAASIDDFLDIHSEDKWINTLGKAAIVRAILKAERSSKLHVSESNDYNTINFDSVENTWFVKLMRVLGPGVTRSNVDRFFENVCFIIFNYDRCVEHFFVHALRGVYGISQDEAAAIVERIAIVHPFGSVRRGVPFGGSELHDYDYLDMGKGIKTYTEQLNKGDAALAQMHRMIEQAKCIVFLGLSYGEQAMKLLAPETPIDRIPIFGTAYGMSESDANVVSEQLLLTFKKAHREAALKTNKIQLNTGLTCSQLFDFYARSLNAA